jgi:protein gp37
MDKKSKMKKHKISWLNIPGYIPQTWNPIIGCSKISDGCRNCYAERMAARLASMTSDHLKYDEVINCRDSWNGETLLVESALQKPLGWKKPRSIFVNSMGDLFHENTPDEWIDQVHYIMAKCPQHLFILLTKRAKRMAEYYSVERCLYETNCGDYRPKASWPLPNVWVGVTAENQAAADERIPHLLRTPAAVRFVSCEPMVGAVKLVDVDEDGECYADYLSEDPASRLDWIICGGESGPEARAMNPEWARSLRDQCQAASVPFFFKQWGAGIPKGSDPRSCRQKWPFHNAGFNPRERNGGDILDGRQWHEFPEVVK